jgi:SRSO17 transposase
MLPLGQAQYPDKNKGVMMELPIVAPAPVVTEHAAVFRDLFDNQCQFWHFQHDLTGLIVLPNKSLANLARCILESADKTNLSRFLSEASWRDDAINHRRLRFMLQQTKPHRRHRRESLVVLDDTLCEHVGSLFDYVDRHYNHGDGMYPLAHNPVTSFYIRLVAQSASPWICASIAAMKN